MEEVKNLVKVGKYRSWQRNHDLIEESYYRLWAMNKRVPSIVALSEDTKLSDVTIGKHLKELDLDTFRSMFTITIPSIIAAVVNEARKTGKAPEVKLAMELVAGYVPGAIINHTFNEEEAKKKIEEIFFKDDSGK